MISSDSSQSLLIALTLFLASWPIYRPINKRYWILALPYFMTIAGMLIQYEMNWGKLIYALPNPIIQLLLPLPFHLFAYFVKRYNLEV